MLGRNNTILASTALVAALALAACTGDTGPPGQDGLGYVPVPAVDQTLGEYNPAGDPVDQELDEQLADSTGVWEIHLDGMVQLDLGDGAPPVVGNAVRYDSDHNEVWVEVDGEWIAIKYGSSNGCNYGVPTPCIEYDPFDGTYEGVTGDYGELAWVWAEHGPEIATGSYVHYGVATAAADMPTVGEAAYSGYSRVWGTYTAPDGYNGTINQWGAVAISVDFGAGIDEVEWTSTSGDVAVDDQSHDLSATATIAGNSYSGTLSGTVVGESLVFGDVLLVDGTLSGTFYGPAADTYDGEALIGETFGVFEASDDEPNLVDLEPTTAVGDIIGGFGAEQDSYTPPPPP